MCRLDVIFIKRTGVICLFCQVHVASDDILLHVYRYMLLLKLWNMNRKDEREIFKQV